MQQASEFQKFGKHFQESLCALILDDREFCDSISEVLNVSYLELKYLQVFVEKIFKYRTEYRIHPSRDTMVMLLRGELDGYDDVVQKQTRDYFARLSNDIPDAAYIKDVSLNFCKKQKLKEAMLKSVDLIENSPLVPFDDVSKILNDSLKAGVSQNLGHDYIKDFEARYQTESRSVIPTGWNEIDKITMGGWSRKSLSVVVSSTGAGKSMFLVAAGAYALMSGLNVVYITLELSDHIIGLRFDSAITSFKINELKTFKHEISEIIQKVPGKLIIKEYPPKIATLQTVQNYLQKVVDSGVVPDMVIVDYGDLLKATTGNRSQELRHDLEGIFTGLRSLAGQFNVVALTASQCNRTGENAELITLSSISEAYQKVFCADFVVSLSRTIKDRNNNTGRLFIAKSRWGKDGLILPVIMNTADVSISVLSPTDETPETIKEKTLSETKTLLKEKYKSWKKDEDSN